MRQAALVVVLALGVGGCETLITDNGAIVGARRPFTLMPAADARVAGFAWGLPPGVPPPPVPPDNPMSAEKVALGSALLRDVRLSRTGAYACVSCHVPERAFTDGRPQAVGATGERHRFGAPSLAYAAYARRLGWASPDLVTLEAQVLVPLLGLHPLELGMGDRVPELLATLRADADFAARFRAVFPDEAEPVKLANLARAIAAYERTLLPFDSPYDRWVFDDDRGALSADARSGARLFGSDRLGCAGCHSGLLFGEANPYRGQGAEATLSVTPQLDKSMSMSTPIRIPSLRNVALTAPYMHDGRYATLDAVLDHYAKGGGGARAFVLGAVERRQLKAFLGGLSDAVFTDAQVSR